MSGFVKQENELIFACRRLIQPLTQLYTAKILSKTYKCVIMEVTKGALISENAPKAFGVRALSEPAAGAYSAPPTPDSSWI